MDLGPTHIHAGTQTIQISTFLAACIFNEGFISILKILNATGITIGPEAHAFTVGRDEVRIERSELQASEVSKKVRTRFNKRTSKNEHFEVEEGGFLHRAGIAD